MLTLSAPAFSMVDVLNARIPPPVSGIKHFRESARRCDRGISLFVARGDIEKSDLIGPARCNDAQSRQDHRHPDTDKVDAFHHPALINIQQE